MIHHLHQCSPSCLTSLQLWKTGRVSKRSLKFQFKALFTTLNSLELLLHMYV